MKQNLLNIAMAATFGMATALTSCQQQQTNNIIIEHQGDTLTVLRIAHPGKYLLLPIQERKDEAQVTLYTGDAADTPMDIRLAADSVDYLVPFALQQGVDTAVVIVRNMPANALCWKRMEVSDTFDITNRDRFRPVYHHTPQYGWMNDANGLVYKDGEYHLYFQYNPYGSVWGNMHWGHSVSKDLVHWEPQNVAIARDTLGHIFSGSCVVDKENSAGFGKDNLIAFYTSASDKNGQIECMAYSSDNGRTFTKYDGNPILTPFDGLKDFRDPKVFWYEPQQKWVMVISADKNMRFYSSQNLKEWTYMSEFGNGYGPQPNQFECPDFVQLPVDGDKSRMKWVLIVNINPGFVFGGSGTMYFVGDFDGEKFTCDTAPNVTKWLDWGKDHYATVCFSNTGDRVIAVPWMSNWQYANLVPTQQFRSANALPRELGLFTGADGQLYMSAAPVKETVTMRKETKEIGSLAGGEKKVENLFSENDGAYELEFEIVPGKTDKTGIELNNSKGECVNIYYDAATGHFLMDRSKSGITDFGNLVQPHEIETSSSRRACVEGLSCYKNDFALATWCPFLRGGNSHKVNVFVDKCSIEIFVDGGSTAMTNLVFPNEPYNNLRLYGPADSQLKEVKAHKLGL